MKRVSRMLCLMLCALVLTGVLSACSGKNAPEQADSKHELHIYTSFYPLYAITEQLLQGVPDTYLHCLVQPQDGCFRNYMLSEWDLALLMGSADMVIIGGRGLESFENTLYNLGENGPAVASVLYNKELAHGLSEKETDESGHWQDDNPHLYMDAEGAILIAESIAAQLMAADPSNEDVYLKNLEDINNRLRSVIEQIKQTTVDIAGNKIILMNESAVYTARAHELEIEFFVERESGEAYYDDELNKLIKQLQMCESRMIMIEKQAPERFCEALEEAGFRLVRIDTMTTGREDDGFEGYLNALMQNSQVVKDAFMNKDN